ncbi:TOM1-like protein 9 [Cucurbita pepo subsp. pepo]|uniref:TOM1-like protein 9 n=1 Tax=Cucurbita pepo subsp. pepo TaxID=3664 RepID=UPI000C9D53A9|nr:TOM1-like protein 9 [Cucurbita pepo subsp. pepo]
MVNPMVERATSNKLIGPDWAVNLEICDMIERDPGKAKDVFKGIKKRLGSKNPKVQLLVLVLLETIIKNCGDIGHAYVAEKGIPREMVKIVKKKPDFRVKEKILLLIDSWQEATGGPTGRYAQYYAAYQELLRAGAVFPQRSEMSSPVLTRPQRQAGSYGQNLHNPDYQPDAPGSSAHVKSSTLSLTEIQLARGVVDVLAEILNTLEPGNKEGIKQDVVVDLVEQCLNYKHRVTHLVNSTSDESLLCQGLSLNDDLRRVLSKHEAITSETSVQKEKPKPQLVEARRDARLPLRNTGDNNNPQPESSISNTTVSGTQTVNESVRAPPATDGPASPAKFDPKLDLLSGDDYLSPGANTSLALVPLTKQQPTTLSEQTALVLFDQSDASVSNLHQHQNFQSPQGGLYHLNGTVQTPGSSHWKQSLYTNASGPGPGPSMNRQQQPLPLTPYNGSLNNQSFPPPPWEAQPGDDNGSMAGEHPYSMKVTQVVFTHVQNGLYPQGPRPMGNDQFVGVYVQPIVGSQISAHNGQLDLAPHTFHGGPYGTMLPQQTGQMTALYPLQMFGNQFHGYGLIQPQPQPQGTQYLTQRVYGLSIKDDNGMRNSSYQVSTSSNVPPIKHSKPEDNLFGDLVDMSKFKPRKPSLAAAGSR